MLAVTALASEYTLSGSDRVDALFTVRTSADMNTCWLLILVRSLPSPTPCRVRRNCRAATPSRVCIPGVRYVSV